MPKGATATRNSRAGQGSLPKCIFACIPSLKERYSRNSPPRIGFRISSRTTITNRANFLWVDSVVGGSIPGNFHARYRKGLSRADQAGVIAGYPVQNVCVEVHFGKDHPVDSNETAFKIAASKVLAEVFKQAQPGLLEPVVNMHITVPADNVGDVSSDLSGRRGQMVGMEAVGGGMTTVEAKVPLAEVSTYARTLSSMTGGQGSYTMEFSHYEVVPGNVQQEIISKAKLKEDED